MSYTYEKLKESVKVEIKIARDEFDKFIEQSYEQNRSKFNIQGFRKGRAPRKVIEKTYGEGVFFDDALDMAFSKEYYEFLQTEKSVEPIENPKIEIKKFDEEELVILAEATILPEIELGEYKGLTITKNKAKVKNDEVDAELEKMRSRGARFVNKEDGAKIEVGDTAIIDFSGSVDGVKFDGGTAKDYRLEIGSHTFIEGFEDQLIGLTKGAKQPIKVKFPEVYPSENLAGKDAIFDIEVKGIETKELPEINDEWASNVSEFETLDAYKKSIKENLEKTLADKIERETENKLIEKIVLATNFDVPDIMTERQMDAFMKDFEMRLSFQGIKLEDYAKYSNTTVEEMRESRRLQARETIKTRIVLEEIIKRENLFVTPGELNEKIDAMAQKYKKSIEDYKKQLGDKQLSYIENELLMSKVLDFLKSNNEIV